MDKLKVWRPITWTALTIVVVFSVGLSSYVYAENDFERFVDPAQMASEDLKAANYLSGMNADVVEKREILALNDDVKSWLDENIRPIRGRKERTLALHEYLFTETGLNIEYAGDETKTAQETFDSRYGNCVSLANLYVASARYLGLKARFQKVKVPRDWERTDEFYILPDHINVRVNLGANVNATVELISTNVSSRLKDRPITDAQAFAEYYSNVGVEYLTEKRYVDGVAYLEKAVDVYPRFAVAWSNLGVAYKLNGQRGEAELAYLEAVKYDKSQLSALKNLYVLYTENNEKDKIKSLSKRVLKYSKKNPYFLAKAADILFKNGEYQSSIEFYNRAIAKKESESEFYLGLAKSHYKLGNQEAAKNAQAMAIEFSDIENRQRYKIKYKYILGSL